MAATETGTPGNRTGKILNLGGGAQRAGRR
jgi:hypothetical protein